MKETNLSKTWAIERAYLFTRDGWHLNRGGKACVELEQRSLLGRVLSTHGTDILYTVVVGCLAGPLALGIRANIEPVFTEEKFTLTPLKTCQI